MPAPTTVDEFLELARKSGVLDEPRMDAYVQKLRAAGTLPSEPQVLAEWLVRDGLLTQFQADNFLLGKWKNFTIGKYKVLERLGSGGMGSVYLCEHKFMRRRVAVKVLPIAKAEDPAALERFYREARAVAALDHPNIVRAYDIDRADKLHFLVMEYVDGASLQEMIRRGGPLSPLRAAHYLRQAALGLQHAHETANLVHRDIKPGNILVDRSGVVKLLDMGLARFFNDDADNITKQYDENVLGTADYLAPEQAVDSHSVDIRADIYSLGATFYFCLTGRTPFSEGTVAQKLIWHQTRQPKPIRSFRNDVSDELLAVIDKMMAKDAADRYQTPAEVVAALEPFTREPIPPPPESEMPRLSPAAMGIQPGQIASPAGETGSGLAHLPLAASETPSSKVAKAQPEASTSSPYAVLPKRSTTTVPVLKPMAPRHQGTSTAASSDTPPPPAQDTPPPPAADAPQKRPVTTTPLSQATPGEENTPWEELTGERPSRITRDAPGQSSLSKPRTIKVGPVSKPVFSRAWAVLSACLLFVLLFLVALLLLLR